MSERPLFNSPEQAITVTFHAVGRMLVLMSWLALVCLHLAAALVVALLMWWFQVTPEQARMAVAGTLSSTTLAVAGALGLTGIGLLTGYLFLVRWLWSKTYVSWQSSYVLQDSRPRD